MKLSEVQRRDIQDFGDELQAGGLAPSTITNQAEFRTKLSELLSDAAERRDHVLVTRNGKPAAALVPLDEYEALEETAGSSTTQRRSPPSKQASPT